MTVATAAVNWTQVLVVGVPAIIAAIFSGVAMLIAATTRRSLRTPSGDTVGTIMERTHDLAAVTVAATTGAQGEVVDMARRHLADGESDKSLLIP